MTVFRVIVAREWTEYGEICCQAKNRDEARAIAQMKLNSDDPQIKWAPNDMKPEGDYVAVVEPVSS